MRFASFAWQATQNIQYDTHTALAQACNTVRKNSRCKIRLMILAEQLRRCRFKAHLHNHNAELLHRVDQIVINGKHMRLNDEAIFRPLREDFEEIFYSLLRLTEGLVTDVDQPCLREEPFKLLNFIFKHCR